jgi:acyl carrier protein
MTPLVATTQLPDLYEQAACTTFTAELSFWGTVCSVSTFDLVVEVMRSQGFGDVSDLLPTSSFEVLGIDSFGVVDIVIAVEQRTGVAVDERQLAGVETVGELVAVVDLALAGR